MFKWLSIKDIKPNLGDFIIAWDGSYYGVGTWTQHMAGDILIGPYLLNETGSCCHSYFKDSDMQRWALLPNPEEEENV